MRVRLFVNPENASATDKGQGVCQNLDFVKKLAKRIKTAGMSLILDFHYSDSWADPAKQWTPKDWEQLNDEGLYTEIYKYTADVLKELVKIGATPDFIQTGNEISYGMLWGKEGSQDHRWLHRQHSKLGTLHHFAKTRGAGLPRNLPASKDNPPHRTDVATQCARKLLSENGRSGSRL